MTEKQTLTYDELLDGVDGYQVDKHQTFAESGVVLVTAPASVVNGLALRPGSQLNVTLSDDGRIEAYSTGPIEEPKAEEEPEPEEEEDDEDEEPLPKPTPKKARATKKAAARK